MPWNALVHPVVYEWIVDARPLLLISLVIAVSCAQGDPPSTKATTPEASGGCAPTVVHMTPPEAVRNHVLGGIRFASPPPQPTVWPSVDVWAAGKNYYGNSLLWLDLPDDGVVRGDTASFTEYRFGGIGDPVVSGHRRDAAAPSPRIEKDNNPGGGPRDRAATIYFPTDGCWEVTYELDGTRLRFVILVTGD